MRGIRLGMWGIAIAMLAVVKLAAFGQSVDDLRKAEPPNGAIWVETLDLSRVEQDYGAAHAGRSVDGNALTINGTTFAHGIGTHADGRFAIDLKGCATEFVAVVGVDDEVRGSGSVTFEVWVDGKKAADSGVMKSGQDPKLLKVDMKGAKRLTLKVTDAGDDINFDHADWAGAALFIAPGAAGRPQSVKLPPVPMPKIVSNSPAKPGIHGPRVIGTTPGRPIVFRIPATGKGPLTFSAKGLPNGLVLDPRTGIVTGSLKSAGTTVVELTVRGPAGKTSRKLKIAGGEHSLALTPPMGWNSWNVWAGAVDDAKVRAAADWMVKSGLAAHGYQYINIDDTWEGDRDANGEIQTNKKFPNMKALADYVHSKGLKLGIYSSPGPSTCAGFAASYKHEEQDAKTYASWEIDYLKYDWCSYGGIAKSGDLPELQKPYRVMRQALDKCGRDIVFSFCQYGMGNVWEWGTEIGGNCWRTTGDIGDSWQSMSDIGFGQDGHEKYASPGHWNDPDMLVVGKLGWGPSVRPTKLTGDEQVTHITLWCLLSSPLLLGCDLAQMDQFTVDLMTNDEVLAVNQDPLGKPAGRKSKGFTVEVWARPLWDGTVAVGLFNRGSDPATVTATWSDLGLKGRLPVRDLWQKRNLGTFEDAFTAKVPKHGAVLVKIGKPNRTDW